MMPPLKPLQIPISMKGFSQVEHRQQDHGGSCMACLSFGIVLLLCRMHMLLCCSTRGSLVCCPRQLLNPASAHLLRLLARTATVQASSCCP